MVKLQRIKQKSGRLIYFVYLPLELIELLGWNKGDEVSIRKTKERNLTISKIGGKVQTKKRMVL